MLPLPHLPFDCQQIGAVATITVPDWQDVAHGIIGQNGALEGPTLLKQVHGAHLVELPNHAGTENSAARIEGDGFLAAIGAAPNTTIAITAADCAPIMLRCGRRVALVHAGWRGLAAGIVEAAVTAITRHQSGGTLDALVGPCAHWCCYEVGIEVVTALAQRACITSKDGDPGKHMLSVGESAKCALQNAVIGLGSNWSARMSYVGICTICDRRFHSFRRDSVSAGRNLAYFAL